MLVRDGACATAPHKGAAGRTVAKEKGGRLPPWV